MPSAMVGQQEPDGNLEPIVGEAPDRLRIDLTHVDPVAGLETFLLFLPDLFARECMTSRGIEQDLPGSGRSSS